MKLVYFLLSFIFLVGCATTTSINTNTTVLDDCSGVSPYYYGEKGQSPVNNDVWKCFQWEIQAR
ncbi:hypothetical protein LCGC14_1418190 [marine sediment metagenome]|uniref:Lipoprotein n=1 Tax=marine sediment metagenome TaxID=412755 RepID=A0A0F9MTV0_9ZZZZ